MDMEELEPKRPEPEPRKLDEMSIDALEEYLNELEEEMARVRETIAAKEHARAAASSIFKT